MTETREFSLKRALIVAAVFLLLGIMVVIPLFMDPELSYGFKLFTVFFFAMIGLVGLVIIGAIIALLYFFIFPEKNDSRNLWS